MHILVVDDDVSSQQLATHALKADGHIVTVVNNGLEALDALDMLRFDAVLMGLRIPVLDGFDTTLEIRRREVQYGFGTPIIAYTSVPKQEVAARVQFDGYIDKPATAETILAALRTATA